MTIEKFETEEEVQNAIFYRAVTGKKIATYPAREIQRSINDLKQTLLESFFVLKYELVGKAIINAETTDDGIDLYLKGDDGFYRLTSDGVFEEISYDADLIEGVPF